MKFLITIFAIVLTFNVFATPISPEQLKKANDYIQQQLEADGSTDISVLFTDGEVDDQGFISALTLEANYLQLLSFNGSVKTLNDLVSLEASAELLPGVINPMNVEAFFPLVLEEIGKWAQEMNEEGAYQVDIDINSNDEGFNVDMMMLPLTDEAEQVKELLVNINGSFVTGEVVLGVEGLFYAEGDLVSRTKVALSDIFYALSNERDPSEDELNALEQIIRDFLNQIQK